MTGCRGLCPVLLSPGRRDGRLDSPCAWGFRRRPAASSRFIWYFRGLREPTGFRAPRVRVPLLFCSRSCWRKQRSGTRTSPEFPDEPDSRRRPWPLCLRLRSLDAYRGLVMVSIASHGLGLHAAAKHFPDSRFWSVLAHQSEHVAWVGCVYWDLILPSFMFMVGVAMAFSRAKRRDRATVGSSGACLSAIAR